MKSVDLPNKIVLLGRGLAIFLYDTKDNTKNNKKYPQEGCFFFLSQNGCLSQEVWEGNNEGNYDTGLFE